MTNKNKLSKKTIKPKKIRGGGNKYEIYKTIYLFYCFKKELRENIDIKGRKPRL